MNDILSDLREVSPYRKANTKSAEKELELGLKDNESENIQIPDFEVYAESSQTFSSAFSDRTTCRAHIADMAE